MTRSDLIRILTEKMDHIQYKDVEAAVKYIFDKLIGALGNGDRIEIRGFGSFALKFRASRMARNPKTGETLRTKSKYSVRFKPGKELRDRVDANASMYPIKD